MQYGTLEVGVRRVSSTEKMIFRERCEPFLQHMHTHASVEKGVWLTSSDGSLLSIQ